MSANLCDIAAGPPPPGTVSNFVDPPSLAATLMGVLGVLVGVGIVVTCARIFVNFRKLVIADYFAITAMVMSIAVLGLETTQLKTSRHIWDIPACYFDTDYVKGVYFPGVLLQLGSFFSKASIFLLFSQIFMIHKPMRIAIWSGLTATFLIYFTGVAISTYYETPHVGETWVDTLDGRTLIPLHWWQLQSALAIALDIYIFVLPLPAIAALNLPIRKRISLMALFSLALLGIGASIASLVERIEIANASDTTWIATILSLCSGVELNVAIIVSSAPGFASCLRLRVYQLPLVQSIISSLSRITLFSTASSMPHDSEAAGHSGIHVQGKGGNVRHHPFDYPTQYRSHSYYEMNDTWMLKRDASVDFQGLHNSEGRDVVGDGGIMRTVVVEQAVNTKSLSKERLVN